MGELYWIFFFCIALITKIGTDAYAAFAKRSGIVDKADEIRKLQKKPVPVSGGVVIFTVMAIVLVSALLYNAKHGVETGFSKNLLIILGTSLVLTITGFIDDKRGITGKNKLLVQILVSSIIVAFAKNYRSVELFGHVINFGHFFFPFAIFWLVGFINAINLVDGADGVATSLGFFIFVSSGIIGLLQGYQTVALLCFIMAATLFGFFLCNKPPAKIYLGDSGSMLIGFIAAILLLNVCVVSRETVRFFPAFAIAFIPILDSFLAVIRRKLCGRSIYFADRSHIHHRIQNRIGRRYVLLATLAILQIPLSLGGIAGIYYKNDLISLGAAALVLAVLIVTGLFGRDELILIVKAFGKLFRRMTGQKPKAEYAEPFITLNHYWQPLWSSIVTQTERFPCFFISLDINIPTMETEYFAKKGVMAMEDDNSADPRQILTVRMPLMEANRYFGNLILQFDIRKCDSREAVELTTNLTRECVASVIAYSNQQSR